MAKSKIPFSIGDCINTFYKCDIPVEIASDIASRLNGTYAGKQFACGSCLITVHAGNQWISDTVASKRTLTPDGLSVELAHKQNNNWCPYHGKYKSCVDAVCDGKCCDEFMRSIICKTVFKDKYAKQR